ncbi:CDP-alcohol phosphatidyltransferase family protein [bacterium]|nr:MAG: CDP-alcohol phosphatidyltransferase family protein [bacterium]
MASLERGRKQSLMIVAVIPNILTIFRIALVPVFAFLVLLDRQGFALAVFLLAGATDVFDGFIARRFGGSSAVGALLDPLADKFLLTTAYLVLTFKEVTPLWLCAPVIARDVIMLSLIAVLKSRGIAPKLNPNVFGKLTTLFQVITVFYALFAGFRFGDGPFNALAIITVAITVISGFSYALRELKGSRATR